MTTTAAGRWWPVLGVIAVSAGLVLAAAIAVPRWSTNAPGHAAADDDPVAIALRTGKPTVVEFGSNRCQSCRDMKPVLAALDRDHGDRLNVVDTSICCRRRDDG